MEQVLLYHGCGEVLESPPIHKTRYTKDFSWGFYCTKDYKQATRRAMRGRRKGFVNVYSYEEDPSLKILKFEKMTDEWLDFIASCRKGNLHDYDIVEGPMADDTVWNYVSDYLNGIIDREAFWVLARFKYPTHQISFHSIRALSCLRFERSEPVNEENTMKDDVFYVCSLIEFIGRNSKNHRADVISRMSKKEVEQQILDAQVNHCVSFEEVSDELVRKIGLTEGTFDTVSEAKYSVPSFLAIGRLYQELVYLVTKNDDMAQGIIDVFSSFLSDEISDFNSDVYYSNPDYLRCCYEAGELLE